MTLRSKDSGFFKSTRLARVFFLALYGVANLYAFFTMVNLERYVGDYGFALNTHLPLPFILVMVLFSYYIVCGPIYNFCVRIKSSMSSACSDIKLLFFGKFVLVLQLLFFIYNFSTGSNFAGAAKPDGLIRFIWFLVPVDYIFYVYYVFARGRNSKLVKLNSFVFILSQLSRGWLGWILVFLYIEFCFWLKKNDGKFRLKFKSIFALILFVPLIIFFPLLIYLKVFLRDALSLNDFSILYSALMELDFRLIFFGFFDTLFFRLQHFSNVVFAYENSYVLNSFLQSDKVAFFYWEGLFPQTIAKLIDFDVGEDIHIFLYSYFINSNSASETTLQTGFISWMFFGIGVGVLYLFYVFFIIFFSIYLSKKTGSQEVQSLTWFFVFLYLMNGWFNAYLFYMQALLIVCLFINVKFRLSHPNCWCKYKVS